MTKIAYFLGFYKDIEQSYRLFERIYTTSDFFYVNINIFDKKEKDFWVKKFKKYNDEQNIIFRFKKTYSWSTWGTFNLTKWTIEGMSYFNINSLDYDYFINLSGYCYPLKSINTIKMKLGKMNLAYLNYCKMPTKIWRGNGGLYRFHYFHLKFWKIFIPFPRLINKLPNNLKPYAGSTWFCLPKKFVDYILEYISNNPNIVRFYKYSFIPDEMFFQTIIMNSPLATEVVNDNLRYIDWSKGEPHPAILIEKDFDKIMMSDKIFARKFDKNIDAKILDLIDTEVQEVGR